MKGTRRITAPWVLGLCLYSTGARANEPPCVAWSGEPSPLPRVTSPDPLDARFAALRRTELSDLARALEPSEPATAYTLWRHALCFDPENTRLLKAVEHTRPVRVHHPAVLSAPAGGRGVAHTVLRFSLREQLSQPVRVNLAPTPHRPEPPRIPSASAPRTLVPDTAELERVLGEAEQFLRAARFEEAVTALEHARKTLGSISSAHATPSQQARLEVITGTAELALGREEAARASFGRALDANPALVLDPTTTSPKVRRAFEAVRGSRPSGS